MRQSPYHLSSVQENLNETIISAQEKNVSVILTHKSMAKLSPFGFTRFYHGPLLNEGDSQGANVSESCPRTM